MVLRFKFITLSNYFTIFSRSIALIPSILMSSRLIEILSFAKKVISAAAEEPWAHGRMIPPAVILILHCVKDMRPRALNTGQTIE
jgi:hypothetical protein